MMYKIRYQSDIPVPASNVFMPFIRHEPFKSRKEAEIFLAQNNLSSIEIISYQLYQARQCSNDLDRRDIYMESVRSSYQFNRDWLLDNHYPINLQGDYAFIIEPIFYK